MSGSDNPYQDDRGNKDRSIANPAGQGSLQAATEPPKPEPTIT